MGDPARLSYVLPLRWSGDDGLEELAAYLRELTELVGEIVVVDGSEPPQFDRHVDAFGEAVRHIRPDPALDYAMGKVNGVITGVLAARNELVVIADDDVRYTSDALARVADLLAGAHLVRPQNYFEPLPWHARIDTARTLLNRVHTGDLEFPAGDFPGSLAIRRSALEALGGYDGDVMFENFELMRSVKAAGGIVFSPLDLFVRRIPPDTPHYLGQRVRQAFDDLGVPQRLAFFLSLLPGFVALLASGRRRTAAAAAAAPSAVAEAGRRRAGGARVYPFTSALLAPLWVAERAVTSWLAVRSKLRHGGIHYAGRIVTRGVNSRRTLRRRLAAVRLSPPGSAEADGLVGAVAEGRDPGASAAADRDRVAT